MEYLLLLHTDPKFYEQLSPAQAQEMLAAYGAYSGALKNAGVLRASNRLRPASSATTVKVKSGKTDVMNGPYVETREELGGYFLIDVQDLDAALSWAARCPAASHGAVEVRPVWAMGEA